LPDSRLTLQAGTLWRAIENSTRQAIKRGALRPIETTRETVEDQGIAFDVRVVSSLALKAHEANPEVHPPDFDPFLPYDQDLFVADISETHVAILNKFPVVNNHLLIITRVFEEQTSSLRLADFEALWACMQEFDGLAFYNAGEVAGASQRHKHFQIVPLPLNSNGPPVPIETAIDAAAITTGIWKSPMLSFQHCIAMLDGIDTLSISEAGNMLLENYAALLDGVGLGKASDERRKYNLLATLRWMMLVPRSREHFEGISINALGFAGELLVMDRDQLATILRHGPMAALEAVAI